MNIFLAFSVSLRGSFCLVQNSPHYFETRVNHWGNETELVIYEIQCSRSLVLICSLCRQDRLFSPGERDKKKRNDRGRSFDISSLLYFLSIICGHPQSSLVILGLLSGLAAWDLSQSIFLCFYSPLWLYTCKGSRKDP